MKNKKIIISVIILILGIGLISYGLFTYWDSNKNNKKEETPNNTSSQQNENVISKNEIVYTPITNYSSSKDYTKEINISNFIIKKEDENVLNVKVNLLNNTDQIINDKVLKINFYKKNELVNTYEYKIEELGIYDEMGIETGVEVEQKITKYEFEFDSFKTVVKPTEE